MANNYVTKDATGASVTFVSYDTGGGTQLAESCPHDGTNKMTRLFNLDSSGVTSEWLLGVGLRLTTSGGSVEAIGQKTMALSIPVAIASNQSALTVAQATAASLNATVVGTGTFAVQAACTGTVALGAGSAVIGHVIVDSGTITTVSTVTAVTTVATVTTVGAVTAITNALPAGSNLIGKFGIDQTSPGATNAVTDIASTAGGATPYVLQASVNSNNSTTVQASISTLYGIEVFNIAAYPVYIKFFNKASAPTPGSDTVVKSILVPCNSTAANGAGLVIAWPKGIAFSTGLSFAIVKGQGNSDNTSVAAGDCTLNIDYK